MAKLISPLFDLVVVGEINADLILRGDVDPVFGQVEKLVHGAELVIGSSAAICACGAARLGLRTAIIGKVGDDVFGRFMMEALTAKGVDTRAVVTDPKIKTGLTVILSKGEDRAILTYPGAIPALRYPEIDLSIVSQARHLHLSSFFMLEGLRPDVPRLFRRAQEMGLSTSLDTNYDPAQTWDLDEALRYIDIFMPNEAEARAIAGEEGIDKAMEELTARMAGGKVPVLVVKQGRQGALVKQGAEAAIGQGSIPVEVVDTVGAGDSLDAGFLYGFLNGWGLGESLRLAVVCGSLSTRKAGGTAAQADLQEAMRYL